MELFAYPSRTTYTPAMERQSTLVQEVRERLQGMTRAEMVEFAAKVNLPWPTVYKVRQQERHDHRYSTISTLAAGLKLRRRY